MNNQARKREIQPATIFILMSRIILVLESYSACLSKHRETTSMSPNLKESRRKEVLRLRLEVSSFTLDTLKEKFIEG